MKIFMITLLISSFSFAKTIKEGEQEYQCTPVKTCEEQLKLAKAEVKKLKKQLSEKKETVVVQEKIVEKKIDNSKKHILSVMAFRQVSNTNASTNSNVGVAEVETKYLPALTYQYQFDNGLVPLLGINSNLSPMIGLGYGW